MKKLSASLSVLLLALSTVSLSAAPKTNPREYRPLVAKMVRMTVAASAADQGKAALRTREGWKQFDAKEWEKSMDCFLSALEIDSSDQSAAEGLTMSVYRMGDRVSACQIAEEFSDVMPWIRGMIAETLLTDVKSEVEEGHLSTVESLMSQLPYGNGAYDRVRNFVEVAQIERLESSKNAVAEVTTTTSVTE